MIKSLIRKKIGRTAILPIGNYFNSALVINQSNIHKDFGSGFECDSNLNPKT